MIANPGFFFYLFSFLFSLVALSLLFNGIYKQQRVTHLWLRRVSFGLGLVVIGLIAFCAAGEISLSGVSGICTKYASEFEKS